MTANHQPGGNNEELSQLRIYRNTFSLPGI